MINRYRISTGTVYEYEDNAYICIGVTSQYTKEELNRMRNTMCDKDNTIYYGNED